MHEIDWISHVEDLVMMWAVVNPFGTVAVFIAVTRDVPAEKRRAIAIRAVGTATIILLFLIATGQLLLEALQVPLTSFQLAGGLVLFLFALTMIFGPVGLAEADGKVAGHHEDPAIFPLAIPAIASPGSMLAVVVLTDNHRYDVSEQAVTAAITLLVMAITLLAFLFASPIQRAIGVGGANVMSRLMGLILASIAVDNVLQAIGEHFNLV